MIDLRLQVNGTQQVERKLHIAADHVSDFSPAFRDIKNSFIRYQRQEFATEGAYGGYAFAPLTPKYAKWKAKHHPGKRILEIGGDLRKSMTSGLQVAMSPRRMIMRSDSTIAGFHQDGTSKMRARKMVAVPKSEKRDWVRFLQRHIVGSR